MFIQARVGSKVSAAGGLSEYDEYIPMVDKSVDAGWKKHASCQEPYSSRGWQLYLHC